MTHRSDLRLLVLHGVHLKGVAEAEAVANTFGLAVGDVAALMHGLAEAGLLRRVRGQLAGWGLTRAGRTEHPALLVAEVDAHRARPRLESAYRRFRQLNPRVLEVCSRWQVRHLAGRLVRNDHADAEYDHAVIGDLTALHRQARPVCRRLAGVLDRYRSYGERLDQAVERIHAGDTDYVAKPLIPSYHTVWFELHEDLLATLGIDRTVEVTGVEVAG